MWEIIDRCLLPRAWRCVDGCHRMLKTKSKKDGKVMCLYCGWKTKPHMWMT